MRRKLGLVPRVGDALCGAHRTRTSRRTTWPYLLVRQHPSPELCAGLVNSTHASRRHSPPAHSSRCCGGPRAGGGGGAGAACLPPVFSWLPALRWAGTPAPMRFAMPSDSPSSRAGAAGRGCGGGGGGCGSSRCVSRAVTFRSVASRCALTPDKL